ncbi:tetratricopeptide repeat protein [Calycomorphotria hydatis]|uniref:Tetratricopeptide repeat protein n=1 Tax=Calycomorphotria hydatis TaxID=2528027 RepID=A0A517TCJ8_9PLAN|nr:hypothetical protein [Calycomorphotria hydatis]QDT66091.1 hypothetical protein V22_33550 [Calycomorphotria hydatis]
MTAPLNRTLRHLTAADGYLDLDMPEKALAELDDIVDAGELDAAVLFLRGKAYKSLKMYEPAIDALQEAASQIPAPYNKGAWLALEDCFREAGFPELASVAGMFATSNGIPADWDSEPVAPQPSDENYLPSESWEATEVALLEDDLEMFSFESAWSEGFSSRLTDSQAEMLRSQFRRAR